MGGPSAAPPWPPAEEIFPTRPKHADPVRNIQSDCIRFPEIQPQYCGVSRLDIPTEADRFSGTNKGDPVVRFSQFDWRRLVEAEEKFLLIGRFAKRRPALDVIRARVRQVLGVQGDIQIGSLDRRTILMRFASEEESRRSWLRNQAVIEGCRFWISRWTPDWRSDRDSPLALVWFQFPNLPIHLFDFEAISRICAPFGRAIALDSTTSRRSRPNMARVRIEINVLQPFVEKVWIEFENGNGKLDGFWQSIVRERVPLFCEYCNRFGHSTGRCWNARTESAEEGECRGMPHACENAQLTEVAANDAPTVGVGAESVAVKLGLEELAREGVSIEHFVDEAVLEAAVNIIEEAAGKVMDEGVECVNGGEDSQKDDTQGEDDPNLETEESSHSISYNTWFENLKEKIGSNKELMTVVMEAKQEVESFFDNAIQELGRDGCEEKANELIQKANGIFLWKVAAKGMSIEKGMRNELRGVRVRAESEMQESGGSSKGEVKNKERVFKNTMEWVKVVDAYMKEDRVLEQKVREALKEVNEYLWTVYDKEKEEYFEEGRNRAMKAAAIFLVKVRHCPSWGRENGLLGRHLKSNIDTIGARICHWAVTMNL